MFFIKFRPTTDVFPKYMAVDALSKQEAWDKTISLYGYSIDKIYPSNEITEEIEVVPFGTRVTYQEIDIHTHQVINTIYYGRTFNPEFEPVNNILNWFKSADATPDNKSVSVQIGCHFEETIELLTSLGISNTILSAHAQEYKKGVNTDFHNLPQDTKLALADAIGDGIVTLIGIGYRMNFNVLGILQEIARSNDSKFENGEPVRDANGKIIKGKNYIPPNLKPYIK